MYPSYTSIYHSIPSYDGICEYMSGYQGVRIPDVLPNLKYTIHRALDGDLFSKSYIELNISMVYDRHLLGIHLVYTTFVLVLVLSE